MGSDQTTLASRPRMRGLRDDAGVLPAPPELSIIVPTYNEGENVDLLVSRLADVLHNIRWEVIFGR